MSPRVIVWYGVLGAPSAWVLQHLAGFGLAETACSVGGLPGLSLDAWTTVITAICLAVAAGGGIASVAAFRATRDKGDAPPAGRVHFLAILGMAITPLFMAIMVFSGVGVDVLAECRQS
jgi:hypothetical protein